MQQALTDVIAKRRDRAIAVLLGIKEREIDQYLPLEARALMRKAILDQLNDFYGLVVDVLGSLDNGDVVLNELYLEKLDGLHRDVARLREQLVPARNGSRG